MGASVRDIADSGGDMDKLSKNIWKTLFDLSFNLIPEKGLYQKEKSIKKVPDTTTELVRLTSPKP